jgi:uncharacterized membrane protein
MPTVGVVKRVTEQENLKKAVCYAPYLGFIPAVAFVVIENNPKVRWHAVQAILTFVVFVAIVQVAVPLMFLTAVLGPLGWLVRGGAGVIFLVMWLVLSVRVWVGEDVRIPLLCEWTDKLVK